MDPTETLNSSPNITKFRDNTDFINVENKPTETQKEQDLSNGDIPKESVEKSENEWTDILGSGGIMKKILQEGHPETRPEKSDKCEINYKCMLEDKTLVEEAQNFEINLGECDVRYFLVKNSTLTYEFPGNSRPRRCHFTYECKRKMSVEN